MCFDEATAGIFVLLPDKKCKELIPRLNKQLKAVANEHQFNEDTLKAQVNEGQKLIRELSQRLSVRK